MKQRRSLKSILEIHGKAEPYRTEGGQAAWSPFPNLASWMTPAENFFLASLLMKMIGYNCRMAKYLDVTTWARRDLFEFFRGFDKPYFNICTSVDVTRLLEFLRHRPETSVTLAYHYFALRIANEIEPFRYRLREGKVLVHDVINGGTTVLQPNESFTFAYFNYEEDFEKFILEAQRSVKEVRGVDGPFNPKDDDDAIHFTTLPWVSFTSFSHARNWGSEDSIPKIAFGKFVKETDRVLLPISVEVHHALVDGVHVGRYLTRLEEALANPEAYLEAGSSESSL